MTKNKQQALKFLTHHLNATFLFILCTMWIVKEDGGRVIKVVI